MYQLFCGYVGRVLYSQVFVFDYRVVKKVTKVSKNINIIGFIFINYYLILIFFIDEKGV